MVCRQLGTADNKKVDAGGGMKAGFPTQIRSAAHALRGLPARVSCVLGLAALVAACAPAPQEAVYQPYDFRPAAAPYYPQQPSSSYYYQPDETDRVINTPAPAPAPPETKSAELQPQPAPAPTPAASPADPATRSPTCGYWRLGCGLLWQ
jgi:hypothetical protein